MKWYLKNEDDSVFGPVEETVIYRWVIQGRVSPESLVSDDEQLWQKAHEIAAFHMDWFVELKDGSTAGPLNLLSLRSFIEDGELTMKSRVSHKRTEDTHYLDEALCPELIRDLATLLASMERIEKELQVARKDAEEYQNIAAQQMLRGPDPDSDEFKLLKENAEKKELFEAAAKKWEETCRSLKEAAEAKEKQRAEEIAALSSERDSLRTQLGDKDGEFGKLREEIEKLRSEASKKSKLSKAEASKRIEAAGNERIAKEAKQWQQKLRKSESEAAARELELKQKINTLMNEHNQLRKDLESTTKQLESAKAPAKKETPASKNKTQAVQPDVTAGSWKDVVKSRDQFEKEAIKWKKLYEEERKDSQVRDQESQETNRETKREELERRTELEQAARKLRQLEKKYEALKNMGAGSEKDTTANMQSQLLAMQETYTQLSESNDALLQQLSTKNEEIKALIESRKSAEVNAAERVKHMEEIVQREQSEADNARQRLAEIEETHHQLIKSYRDMNDRFIRMKQEQVERGTGTKAEPEEPPSTSRKKKRDKGSGRRLRLS